MRALALLTCVLVPSIAAADPAPPQERHGLFGGVALQGGHISCDGPDCDGFGKAGGGDGHIGWMFKPNLGVMLDVWGMSSSRDNITVSYVSGTINLRYWVVPVLWVQGGLGSGHAEVHYFGLAARGDDVPVGLLAAGVELVKGKQWALDLELKVAQGGATDEDDNGNTTGRMVGAGVGFTYFGSR